MTPTYLPESRTFETLEQERLALQSEINAYPAPIPACDVYFNALLERRSRICEEIDAIKASATRC